MTKTHLMSSKIFALEYPAKVRVRQVCVQFVFPFVFQMLCCSGSLWRRDLINTGSRGQRSRQLKDSTANVLHGLCNVVIRGLVSAQGADAVQPSQCCLSPNRVHEDTQTGREKNTPAYNWTLKQITHKQETAYSPEVKWLADKLNDVRNTYCWSVA